MTSVFSILHKLDLLIILCASWALPAVGFALSRQLHRQPIRLSLSNSEDDFMASLRGRILEVNDRATKLPLVVLDCMLPKQVLRIQVENPLFMELVRSRLAEEEPRFGMLGMARVRTGEQVHLKNGVEVHIRGKPEVLDMGVRLELEAGRRFRIQGEIDTAKQGWTEARVQFLDSVEEETKEVEEGMDRMALARAISKARMFTSPNFNVEGTAALVDRWVQLARENERKSGQITQLLEDLGDIPPPEEPSERAFWIGALINPLPAMGVAMEIRPALLTAKTAEERVQVALDGITQSIKHMDGSARMW